MSYRGGNMRRDTGRRSNDFGGGRSNDYGGRSNDFGGGRSNDFGGGRSNDFGGGSSRRSGGGNYLNNYDNYSSPMNPWEGGMVPGRSGNSGMMPPSSQGDLLSQLTSPEAQLALASNLINKLINQQQQSVPSLLNIGSMSSGGGHMSSFNDGYGNTRNFQDRRRGRMDQRRTEPYNKSGMIRRNIGTDRRNLGRNRMGSDRKTPLSKSPKSQKDDKDKKDKDAEKNGDVKTDSADESKREEDKDEDAEVAEDSEKKNAELLKEKILPIPAPLLYCHVCSKNMWDETSFTKHMKGRPHQLMMDGLSEKYKLKVDLLRHEMRIAEKQREMELERKQRQGVKMFNHAREYCAMCDLHFYGHLISHRKNIHHQKLKSFLHPKCSHCNKEFSTRLEWDDHRLSFYHLRKVADFRRVAKPHIKDDEYDIDELVCPESVNCGDMITKEVPVLVPHQSEDEVAGEMKEEPMKEKEDLAKDIKKEPKEDDAKGDESITSENKEKEELKESEAQGIDLDPSKLPKYNSAVVVGKDLVISVSGYVCRVCNRFMQGEDETQVHCRTLTHYNNYCNIVRTKARVTGRRKTGSGKVRQEKAEDDKGEEERNEDDKVNESADGGKLDTTTDDEGNWKRRKVTDKNDESMEVEESKPIADDIKEEIPDSVWEEVDKDIDAVYAEIQNAEEEGQEEENPSPARRSQRGRGGARGKRGAKRGK